MTKRPTDVEWHVVKTDAEWEALHTNSPTALPPTRQTAYVRWRRLLLIVLIVGGSSWLGWRTQTAPSLKEEDLGRVVLPSAETPFPPQLISATEQPPTAPMTPWPTTLSARMATPQSNALANWDVIRMLENPEQGIQLYQEMPPSSLRTFLTSALWGAKQRTETEYFILHFRQRDNQAVVAATRLLDQLYVSIQQNFGLPPDVNGSKIVIHISETRVRATAPYRPRIVDQLTVSSPALDQEGKWEQTDLLLQSIMLPLVDHILGKAVEYHHIGLARGPLLDGLRLWQLWELPLPLAAWRLELVRWLYVEAAAAHPTQPISLPIRYTELCDDHQLWMSHPAQLRIPFLCTKEEEAAWRFSSMLRGQPPYRLPWLNAPIYLDEEMDAQGHTRNTRHPGEAIAIATLIDYTVHTYGSARLPALVASLGEHSTWESLTLDVLGIPATAFEAGWQRYLGQTYLDREAFDREAR